MGGRWELEGGGQRDQGHPGVGRGEEGGGRVGGSCEGGCQPQVLQLRSPRHGGSHPTVALFGFCGAKKESQCLLSLYSICVFIILLQIAAMVFINVDDANINFIKEKISNEAAKIDIEDPEKLAPGSKFVQNLFLGSPPASPPSSSSSRSPSAVERGGRRECKDMLKLYRLNQAHSVILFLSNIFLSTKK